MTLKNGVYAIVLVFMYRYLYVLSILHFNFRIIFQQVPPPGMTMFNVQKFCSFAHRLHLCVPYASQKEQRLFPHTALTDGFLSPRRRVFTPRYGLGI